MWQKTRHASIGKWWDGILSHWKLFIYLVILMAMMNFSSHGTQDLYPTFLERDWKFSAANKASLTAFMMSGAIVGGICFGLLSDRIGRRLAMIAAFVGAIGLIPIWAFAPSLPLLVAGAFLMQFMIQGAWGVIPAHITELSPDSVRGFLPGFAYQCGVLIAGTIGWFETKLAERMTYAKAMGLLTLIIFCVAILVVGMGKERRAIRFGEEAS